MKRRDLNPSVSQLATRLAAARAEATAAATAPAGNKALTDGADITWGQTTSTDADDGETHGTWTQTGSVRDTANRVSTLEATAARLAEGIATAGRWNTVSTSQPPETTDGCPDGAWWVQVASATDTTATACWQAVDGQWASQPLPANQVIAPTLNAGLIDVALLAAKLVTSDEFRTAASGQRTGLNTEGFYAYNADDEQTVHIDGQNNLLAGQLRAGGSRVTSWRTGSATRAAILFDRGATGSDAINDTTADALPRVVGSWPSGQDAADIIISSGLANDKQALFQLSRQTGKASLGYQDGAARAELIQRTDTASYLGGYSSSTGASSGIQYGNGWIDLIGQIGTSLSGTMIQAGVVSFGQMNTGSINRTTVTVGGNPPSTWTGKWMPIIAVYDWDDAARLVPKVTAADRTSFKIVTECTSGSTRNGGFLWLAIRRGSW